MFGPDVKSPIAINYPFISDGILDMYGSHANLKVEIAFPSLSKPA